jgi:hypothetical protein
MTRDDMINDEKYAKAAKQSQRKMLILVGLALVVLAGCLVHFGIAHGGVSSQSHLPATADVAAQDMGLVAPSKTKEPSLSLEELETLVQKHDAAVRTIKEQVEFFEKDEGAQAAAKFLQDATRQLLHKRYGIQEPYRVAIGLEFQDTMPDFAQNGKDGSFVIELAPSSLQPHSIYTFLEVSRQWKAGAAFHRFAHHVLQVMAKTTQAPYKIQHLAFQEYSPEYPHNGRTVGYAGRPSGPAWYVSLIDNSHNHGPGSQQKRNPYEADSCFGKVISGWEDSVLRMKKVPGKEFLNDAKKHVLITSMIIQVPSPSGDGTYVPWKEEKAAKLA